MKRVLSWKILVTVQENELVFFVCCFLTGSSIDVAAMGKDIDIICFYDPQQTDYQPEPSDGDPRGATCTAGTSYSARRPARGVRPLRQHVPCMYSSPSY